MEEIIDIGSSISKMDKAVDHFHESVRNIRSGGVTPALIDSSR